MLNNINKLLTGDLLKILCDMGHAPYSDAWDWWML